MNKKNKLIIYIYAAFLLLGGSMGYFKGGSKVSLLMASIFSLILLALVVFSKKMPKAVSYIAFSLLLVDSFFTYRFLKSWKWMPSGVFSLVTFAFLILFLKLSDQTRNKARRAP